MKTLLSLIVLLLGSVCVTFSQSVFEPVWACDTVKIMYYDLEQTPYAQYLNVTRYYNDVAAYYYVGELGIIQQDGDTIDLRWDHPIAYGDPSILLPIYNAQGILQNELVTETFHIDDQDTLRLYHDKGLRFVPYNSNGELRSYEEDTSYFAIPDTIKYALELVNAQTEETVSILDSITFLPASSWFEYCNHLAQDLLDSTNNGGSSHYLVSHPCGLNFQDGDYRIRLSARSSAMTNGGIDSMFFAYFAFNARHSKWLNSVWDSVVQVTYDKFVYYLDSIAQLNKDRFIVPGKLQIKDSKVYPSIVNRANPIITITGLNQQKGTAVNLIVYALDGRRIASNRANVFTDVVTFRLGDHLSPGMYVLVANNENSYSINTIILK